MAENSTISPLPLAEGPGVRAAGVRTSPNPYAQVALTYVRRLFSSVQAGIVTVLVVGWLGFLYAGSMLRLTHSDNHFMPDQGFRVVPLMLAGIVAAFLAGHVKEQFAASRSHLMPHFRWVHIVVPVVATLIVAVITPAILTWLWGLRSVGLVASTVLMFGVISWCVAVLPNWTILQIIIIVSIFSETMKGDLRLIVSGQFEAVAVGILALGSAIIVLVGMYLFRLNEDMPTYHCQPPSGWMAKGRMTRKDVYISCFREQSVAYLVRHAQLATCSRWSQICRWQWGMATGWRVSLWAILPVGLLQVMNWLDPQRVENAMTSMMVGTSFAFLPLLMSTTQLMSWLTLRLRVAGHELVLPVERRTYARQVGAALALGCFQIAGTMCAGIIAWWLLAIATPPPVLHVISLAAIALLMQIFMFGVLVFAWTVTSNRLVQVATYMASLLASIILLTGGFLDSHFRLRPEVWSVGGGFAVLGVLLAYIAYRRWLRADFD